METKAVNYPSKVDTWLVILLVGTMLAVLIFVGMDSFKTGDFRPLWFAVACELVTTGLVLLISFPLRYQLGPEKIIVQSGVMRTEVPVSKITGIQKTRNPLSAPAWSLDRLKIAYDNDGYPAYIVISPRERERFIETLETYRKDVA